MATREDTCFRENAAKAREAGLKTGFYFYVTAENPAQARQQVFRTAPARGLHLPPAVDLSSMGASPCPAQRHRPGLCPDPEARTGITLVFYTNAYSAASIWEGEPDPLPPWMRRLRPQGAGIHRSLAVLGGVPI